MLPMQFEQLPSSMQLEAIKPYFDILNKRRTFLIVKRVCDIACSLVAIILTSWLILIAVIGVALSSKGPVFFFQERVGLYRRPFKIFKFRTMVQNAEQMGASITVGTSDPRITPFGALLRKTRIDELPQLFNILIGDMSMVGARPEVTKYVDHYTDLMCATLLTRPGLTGLASIKFKDENQLLSGVENPEQYYIDEILPIKMALNLDYLKNLFQPLTT